MIQKAYARIYFDFPVPSIFKVMFIAVSLVSLFIIAFLITAP